MSIIENVFLELCCAFIDVNWFILKCSEMIPKWEFLKLALHQQFWAALGAASNKIKCSQWVTIWWQIVFAWIAMNINRRYTKNDTRFAFVFLHSLLVLTAFFMSRFTRSVNIWNVKGDDMIFVWSDIQASASKAHEDTYAVLDVILAVIQKNSGSFFCVDHCTRYGIHPWVWM